MLTAGSIEGALEGMVSEIFIPIPREDNPRLSQVDFEPLANWCLIYDVGSAIEARGIIIPEAYGQTFRRGLVAATGPGTMYTGGHQIECTVNVGDIILYGKAAGLDVTLKEGAFKLVREAEMFGRIPKAAEERLIQL